MAQRYFATINPGLEEALLAEVRELGGKRASKVTGGVEFDATNTVFYRAVRELRCTNRIWLRIDEFRARDAPELYNKTNRIDWARLIPADVPIEVRGVSRRSALTHSDRVADAVRDGIDDSLGRDRPADGEPLIVLARVVDNRCELSLDASGELHYQRGYKTEAVAAPLRESVASAVLRLAGWTPDQPLLDPFCGSGTIIIEAAQIAAGFPAGATRTFAMQRWANFRPELWAEIEESARTRAGDPRSENEGTQLHGTDIDPDAVAAARHNAEAAHVAEECSFDVADVADLAPPEEPAPGWIVTNPPWNLRLDDPSGAGFAALMQRFEEHFTGWRLAVIAPRRWSPGRGEQRATFQLGGVPVSLWVIVQVV